jgi:hypothetical protein
MTLGVITSISKSRVAGKKSRTLCVTMAEARPFTAVFLGLSFAMARQPLNGFEVWTNDRGHTANFSGHPKLFPGAALCTMQVCTTVFGKTAVMASGKPFLDSAHQHQRREHAKAGDDGQQPAGECGWTADRAHAPVHDDEGRLPLPLIESHQRPAFLKLVLIRM